MLQSSRTPGVLFDTSRQFIVQGKAGLPYLMMSPRYLVL